VILTVFNQKKYTKPKETVASTSVIHWREHFFFTQTNLSILDIENSKVSIEVRNHKFIQKDSLIGLFEFDLTYLYYQPNHAIVHRWIALSNPDSPDFQKIRGHIKLGISVQNEGDDDVDLAKPEFEDVKDSEILLPPQISLKPFQMIVTIIKAEGLPKLDDYFNETIDAFCEVNFAGGKIKTSVLKADQSKFAVGWYEELYLPVMMPNISKKVVVKVMDQDKFKEPDEAGSIVFGFDKVQEGEFKNLAWFNLYGASAEGKTDFCKTMNSNPETASCWHGRLLIKIDFFKCEKPALKCQHVRTEHIVQHVNENFDPISEYEIRAHIFSGVALSKAFEEYSLAVCWGGTTMSTSSKKSILRKCDWYEKLPKKIIKVPNGSKDLCDIFLYLVNNESRICFARLPTSDFQNVRGAARWVSLLPDRSLGILSNEWDGGFVQLRLYIGKYTGKESDKDGNWHIPPVPPAYKKTQESCIFFNLYQCRDLPAADSDGQSDPYIEIYCNGKENRSEMIQNTLNPMWYSVLTLDVPFDNPEKLPPIIVYVKDRDNSKDELLGYCTFPLLNVDINLREPKRPEWKDLSFGKLSGGKILASVNFFSDKKNLPGYSLEPKCFEATAEINCIGLRDLTPAVGWLPVNKAFIKFDMNSIQVPSEKINLRNVETQPGESGANPTINTVIKFNFWMPEDMIFAPALTCIVYDYLFKGLSQPQIGVFTINLGDLFHKKRISLLKFGLNKSFKLDNSHNHTGIGDTDNNEIIEKPSILAARKGAFVIYPKIVRNKKTGRLEESVKIPASYMKLGYNRFQDDQIMHYRFVLESELELSDYIEKSPFDTFHIKRGVKREEDSWLSTFLSFKNKEDVISEYTVKNVGLFKAIIRVTKTEKQLQQEEKVKKLKNQDEHTRDLSDYEYENFSDIRSLLLKKNQVVVRVYVVECKNLAQKDLKSHSDPYIKIKLAGKVINDSDNFQQDQPNPKFLKSFDILTTLPGASRLKIQIWDRDNLVKDDKIGETIIDLEDRYFSNSWRRLKEKPIEKRNLYIKSTNVVQGSILMWLEIHNPSGMPEALDITPRPPVEFEARLIIWQTKDVESYDIEDTSDLYIRASINNLPAKETDTHYRCRDGNGQFNWRMKFPLTLPAEDYLIDVQIWDRDVFSANDFIGSASFYFRELARDCFDRNKRIMMRGVDKEFHLFEKQDSDKFWVECFRNKDGEKESAGKVQISFELIPKNDADACPVGDGREEPNIDPFLDDPRGRFEWSLNPFKLINQVCGPAFKGKICCAFCCVFCCYMFIMIAPSVIGSLIGGTRK
jgi:hypothetical protein